MIEALSWAAFLGSFVLTVVLVGQHGFPEGLRRAWFLAMLAIPAWCSVAVRSLGIDAPTGVSLAALVVILRQPWSGRTGGWALTDLLVGAVVITAVISDLVNGMLIPGTVLELTRQWVLPYLVGRLSFQAWSEARRTLPWIVALTSALSLYAIVEALMQVNLLAMATGKRWELLEGSEGFRWGLKRAQGITNHPIYLGLLLCLVLPWTLAAGREAREGNGPGWWRAVPWWTGLGAFMTVARTAHLALALVIAVDLFFRRPSWRLPMLALGLAGAAAFVTFRAEILDLTGSYAGDLAVGSDRVRINGIEYDYTGTRHRDLLALAYADAIDAAGWFGFGTNLRDMPRDPFMDHRFVSIDHHYLLHFLRYGLLGVGAFLLLATVAIGYLALAAWSPASEGAALAGGMCGAVLATTLLLRGVAAAPDFAFMWLFAVGWAASLHRYRRSIPSCSDRSADVDSAPPPTDRMPDRGSDIG